MCLTETPDQGESALPRVPSKSCPNQPRQDTPTCNLLTSSTVQLLYRAGRRAVFSGPASFSVDQLLSPINSANVVRKEEEEEDNGWPYDPLTWVRSFRNT